MWRQQLAECESMSDDKDGSDKCGNGGSGEAQQARAYTRSVTFLAAVRR